MNKSETLRVHWTIRSDTHQPRIHSSMNSLHKAFFAAATAGTLWLTAAATPALAATPTTYDATGPVVEMTDTTLTIMYHGKDKWTFARDTTTKGADAVKVGDKITVHYTMMAGSVDMAKGSVAAPAKKGDKKATAPAAAAASPAGATEAQKPAAESGSAASPAATPGH